MKLVPCHLTDDKQEHKLHILTCWTNPHFFTFFNAGDESFMCKVEDLNDGDQFC